MLFIMWLLLLFRFHLFFFGFGFVFAILFFVFLYSSIVFRVYSSIHFHFHWRRAHSNSKRMCVRVCVCAINWMGHALRMIHNQTKWRCIGKNWNRDENIDTHTDTFTRRESERARKKKNDKTKNYNKSNIARSCQCLMFLYVQCSYCSMKSIKPIRIWFFFFFKHLSYHSESVKIQANTKNCYKRTKNEKNVCAFVVVAFPFLA